MWPTRFDWTQVDRILPLTSGHLILSPWVGAQNFGWVIHIFWHVINWLKRDNIFKRKGSRDKNRFMSTYCRCFVTTFLSHCQAWKVCLLSNWRNHLNLFLHLFLVPLPNYSYYKPIFINDSTRSETVFHTRKVHLHTAISWFLTDVYIGIYSSWPFINFAINSMETYHFNVTVKFYLLILSH